MDRITKNKILSIAEELGGDEQNWIELKSDYHIGGIKKERAEFVKDVSSIANMISERELRLILVGFNDNGDLVGINEDQITYRGKGPRHIFSFDEADIQKKLEGLLEPHPIISWHTYTHEGCTFGSLLIEPPSKPPSIIKKDFYDETDNQLLHEGRFWTRYGSSKNIAGRSDLEDIIDKRINQRRDEILEGITKAVEIGPEAVARLGGYVDDGNEDSIPITIEEESDWSFDERVSRKPATNLDSQLNEDIVQTKYRGDDYIPKKALWEYYANHEDLTLDEPALSFLTNAAIKNNKLGAFWLEKSEDPVSIIYNIVDKYHRNLRAARVLFLAGAESELEEFISDRYGSDTRPEFDLLLKKVNNTNSNRLKHIRNNSKYTLKNREWAYSFDTNEIEPEESLRKIPELTSELYNIEHIFNEERKLWERRDSFENGLHDLECVVCLGETIFPNN